MESLSAEVRRYLAFVSPDRYPVQISYYGGTFLGLGDCVIKKLLAFAAGFIAEGGVHGIRFSTRPDSVTKETLDVIRNYPVKTVELGVQSMDDTVLARSNRGHTAGDTEKAADLLRERGYETGFQIMVGLPGDDRDKIMKTAERLAALRPDFVRIYPALVLANSDLETMYLKGEYTPLSLAEAVAQVKRLYLYFKGKDIPVIRMGLQASDELDRGSAVAAGPYHPAFGHMVHSSVFLDMACSLLKHSVFPAGKKEAVFYVHSKNISKLRGLKNNNLDVLKTLFSVDSVTIHADDRLDTETLTSESGTVSIIGS